MIMIMNALGACCVLGPALEKTPVRNPIINAGKLGSVHSASEAVRQPVRKSSPIQIPALCQSCLSYSAWVPVRFGECCPFREREGQREMTGGRRSTAWAKSPFPISRPTTGPSAGPQTIKRLTQRLASWALGHPSGGPTCPLLTNPLHGGLFW